MGKFSDLKPKTKLIDNFIDESEIYQNKTNNNNNKKENMERLNVEVSKSLHKAIKIKAAEQETKIKNIVINALNEYLSK